MASTATSRLRLNKQATYDNPETWGVELNNGMIDMVDDSFGGSEITVSGDVTLTVQNYTADQARSLFLMLDGAGGFDIEVPAVDKAYLVINGCSADVTITPLSGNSATIRAGTGVWWYCDGTDGYVVDPTLDQIRLAEAALDLNGQKITNVGKATDATDAATLENRLDEFTAPNASVAFNSQKITGLANGAAGSQDAPTVKQTEDMIGAAGAINLPSPIGHGGEYLKLTDAEDPEWQELNIQPLVVTANTDVTGGTAYRITASSGITLTLPATPDTGDTVTFIDGESISNTVTHTVARNGNTIQGQSEDLTLDVEGISLTLWWSGSDWRLF